MTGSGVGEQEEPTRAAVPEWTVSALRRRPAQRRSLERVERLLHACARQLEEVGYYRLTTTEVARRADLPIGTLYQFFTDKNGLVRALAARNLELYGDRLRECLSGGAARNWTDVAVIAVDAYVRMRRTVPGFGVLDVDPPEPEEDRDCRPVPRSRGDARVAGLVVEIGGAALGPADAATRRRALVAVEAADAVLAMAFRAAPGGDDRLIGECKDLLRAYLGSADPGAVHAW